MDYLSILRSFTNANGRLGFYTRETQHKIPEGPGCYAWFLPLWCYRDDLADMIDLVGGVFDYESKPELEVEASFTWDVINLRVRRDSTTQVTSMMRDTWARIRSDPDGRKALEQMFLEASLLTPPLYVGRTKGLKQRYLQHTSTGGQSRNDFHRRFTDCVSRLDFKISVSDLWFVCIQTDPTSTSQLKRIAGDDVEALIEFVLMQLCRPPFSLK